jgi:hypothetical protein
VIASFTIKREGIIGLDLLKVMKARIDFKTDQLEIGGRKFPLRSAEAGVVRADSPSLEAIQKEPESGREPSRGAKEGGRRTTQETPENGRQTE